MPFQSEKQRRYLWANEPEIAREWTDRYGANQGGIMDVASNGNLRHDFQNYTNSGGNVSVPTSFQARPHSDPVNLAYVTPQEQGILQNLKPGTPHEGPMGIPNYDSFDAAGGYSNPDTGYSASSGGGGGGWQDTSRADQRVNERAEQVRRNYVNKENIRSSPLHKRYNPNWKMGGAKNNYMGNIWRGIMSMFGGVPGKIGSLFSRFDPRQLRGGMTQKEYEDARTDRRRNKRMNYLSDRKSKGLGYGKKAYADLLAQGLTDPFQDAIQADYESGMNTLDGPFAKTHLQGIDLSGYDNTSPYMHDLEAVPPRSYMHDLEAVAPGNFNYTNVDPSSPDFGGIPQTKSALNFNNNNPEEIISSEIDYSIPITERWANQTGLNLNEAKVADQQKKIIDNQATIYGKVNAASDGTPGKLDSTTQTDIFNEAKKFDDTGSSGVFGIGATEPSPMSEQEYKDYLISQGYI